MNETVEKFRIIPENTSLEVNYLRRLFSSIVWGNVKPAGIEAIERNGPLRIYGKPQILNEIDSLIQAFASQKRMRLVGDYKPVYTIAAKK
jgi:hypothetical protein